VAKLDRAKEYIGFLKAIFIMLVAIDSSLIAWLFKNSELNSHSIFSYNRNINIFNKYYFISKIYTKKD